MPVETRTTVDETVLDSYRVLQEEGQPDIVTEFIDVFLADLPGRIEQLRQAVASASARAVKSSAHALKGSSGSVGAVMLSGLCGQLEANARAGSTDGALDLLTAIEAEAVRADQELRRFRVE